MAPTLAPTLGEPPLASPPSTVFLILLGFVIASLTFGMGATLTWAHVEATIKRRKPAAVGLGCQYVLMPLIAYALAKIFNFSPAMSVGLLLCGIVPGGATSNLFTYFTGGDVGLSIFMTVTSVLCAIFMLPALLAIYGPSLLEGSEDVSGGDFVIPYGNIVSSLLLVLLPTMAGIALRHRSDRLEDLWARRVEKFGSGLGVLFIVGAIASGIVDNSKVFDSAWTVWVSSAALSLLGFGLAVGLSLAAGLSKSNAVTIGLEVGVQNTILSITIAIVAFKDARAGELNEALVFPLFCSLWDVVNSVLCLVAVRLGLFGELPQRADEPEKADEQAFEIAAAVGVELAANWQATLSSQVQVSGREPPAAHA